MKNFIFGKFGEIKTVAAPIVINIVKEKIVNGKIVKK